MPGHCHKLIRSTAQAAAGELYETLMGDNVFFSTWQKQNPDLSRKGLETRFVAKNWPRCIPFARATLTQLLLRPDIDSSLKEDIMSALVLDSSLVRGRVERHQIVGSGQREGR